MSRFLVRSARGSDFEAVNRVQADALRNLFSQAAWSAMAADDDRGTFVAESDGAVVGWASTFFHAEDDGPARAGHYLAGVTVHPDVRRRGVGRALIAMRLGWIAERADSAWYFANARNTASLRAHRDFGFVEVGRASSFHGVPFAGGAGIVFRADKLESS